jgi:uncharacterized membrane protein
MQARFDRLDALRAVAMLWMTAYHFCYDLQFFGVIHAQMNGSWFWIAQRTCIVGLFLFTAGMGQAISLHQQPGACWQTGFTKRWLRIVGGAAVVSIMSLVMFPKSYIYFGVLHAVAFMLPLLRCLQAVRLRWVCLLGGLSLLAPGALVQLGLPNAAWQLLNARPLNWLGFISQKPFTEDYVPLWPWFGVVCGGFAAGRWVLQHRIHWLTDPMPMPQLWGSQVALPALGRYSLSYYMLHQPVLLGMLVLIC